jgi:outer membrane protein OmpA-like peptidoglycan-associated protein
MKINGFDILVDLSSSMVWLSPCRGSLTKDESVSTLLRKINQRIPQNPYLAALRVFGYQSNAWREDEYTTLYYGPETYDSDKFDLAVGRLAAANTISPYDVAIRASAQELGRMSGPRAALLFSDFELSSSTDDPAKEAGKIAAEFAPNAKFYTFYASKRSNARGLARKVAGAGNGKSYDICEMLADDSAFEAMMDEIFGPKIEPPCPDADQDGVCDDRDVCPSTPLGAPVDGRGCWIAAYSQFFDFDKAVVKREFHPRLEYAAKLIIDNPAIPEITIAGHTDSVGSDQYNLDLGRRRAEAVRDLLVKFGAPAAKLTVESFGKSMPIADNATEEGRAKNRRVEFHVGDVPASPLKTPLAATP